MEIAWIEDFLALSAARIFARAAEARNISQPAFTRRIKNLEHWVGAPLFDRSVHPVVLTPAGETFKSTAHEVMLLLTTAKKEVRDLSSQHGKILNIVSLHTLAVSYVPGWITEIESSLGSLNIRINAENFSSCVESVLSGSSDFMLCYHHATVPSMLDDDRYPSVTLAEDTLIAVCSPNTSGSAKFDISGEEVFPYLAYTSESILGRVTKFVHEKSNLSERAQTRHENSSSESLKSACIEGLGVAWLPTMSVMSELNAGTLIRVSSSMHETSLAINLHRSIERSRSEIERLWNLSTEQQVSDNRGLKNN